MKKGCYPGDSIRYVLNMSRFPTSAVPPPAGQKHFDGLGDPVTRKLSAPNRRG